MSASFTAVFYAVAEDEGLVLTAFTGRAAFSALTGRETGSGLASFACFASEANDAGSLTAISARTFRSSVTPAAFSPAISCP